MDYCIFDDIDSGYFIIETYGEFVVDDDNRALGEVINHSNWSKGKKLLVDHRDSTFDKLTVNEVVHLSNVICAIDKKYGPSYCAIVVPSGVIDKAAYYKFDVCSKIDIEIKIFHSDDYQDAIIWLVNQPVNS